MRTTPFTSPVPRERIIAAIFLTIGGIGIPPALCLITAFGAAMLDGLKEAPGKLLVTALLGLALTTMFTWGMALWLGYIKTVRGKGAPWRALLWRGTIAYNALLGLAAALVAGLFNPVLLWFAALVTLAAVAHRTVSR
jgi:hypothetical protein